MKMNQIKIKNKIALVCMIAILFGSVSFAQGVGGDETKRDAYLAELEKTLGKTNETQTSTEEHILSWSRNISIVLNKGFKKAMLEMHEVRAPNDPASEAHKQKAEQILIDTLVKAAESLTVDPKSGGPMVKKLIDRTLMYSRRLDQEMPSTGVSLGTKVNFLFNSIQFILMVQRDLDIPYYIPYRYRHHRHQDCSRCSVRFDYAAFESRFIKIAGQQIDFLIKGLTEVGKQDGVMKAFPLGNPTAFLVLVEMASQYIADDLKDNIHAYSNCYAIDDLTGLSEELIEFNASHPTPAQQIDRIRDTVDYLQEIRSEMNIYYRSRGYDRGYGPYSDIYNYQNNYELGGHDHE